MQSNTHQDYTIPNHQDFIKSNRQNIRYQKGVRICKIHSDSLIALSNDSNSVDILYLYLFDYLFDYSISGIDQFSIFFNKENHVVHNDRLLSHISTVQCDVNLDNNKVYVHGDPGYLRFRVGERHLRWYHNFFHMFDSPHKIYTVNNNGVNEMKYEQVINGENMLIFLNGYSSDILNIIKINNKARGLCEINSVKNGSIESILINYTGEDAIDLLIQNHQVPYKFQTIMNEFGPNVAIKLLGYTPYILYKIMEAISIVIHNDSNSAIASLVILLLMIQGTPYLLLLFIRLLKRRNINKNKHINDNEDTCSYLLSLVIKNWKYIVNIFIIYSIYGITSSKNILQKLDLKDGTILNCGKSLLEDDNTCLFLQTRFGYLSILKIILFVSLVAKQLSFMSQNTKFYDNVDIKRKIFIISMIFFFIYAMKINYSFILIIIITNLFLGFGDVAINNITS